MHPAADPLFFAFGAALVAAGTAAFARWRDLSALPLCLAASAALVGPVWAGVPAVLLAGVGVARGLSRGVARPELTWLGLGLSLGAHALGAAVPRAIPTLAVLLGATGVLLAALATIRRSTVKARVSVTARIPVR